VRNTCFGARAATRRPEVVEFDETEFEAELGAAALGGSDPAALLEQRRLRTLIDAAIRALSPALREVIVLREFEDLDYAQIAQIAAVPVGTVMSRLSRAREKLRSVLSQSNLGH
jgi:RNA polymerase sigma-70 factor (ECF subfamily)